MIIGSCPYDDCNEPLMLGLPDMQLPAFSRHECDGCHRLIWTKFSRVDPQSWTEDGFLEEYEIDEETRQLKPRASASADAAHE